MKLPDFTEDSALNELRRKMSAELRIYVAPRGQATITEEEVEALATKGIEIPLGEVELLNDGTFTYKGRRVVVYIRDVTTYRDEYSMPKFHLAMCDTLLTMKEEGRYEKRYVVANREDGLFRIQKVSGTRILSSADEKLDICQNCLHGLHYKNFNRTKSYKDKAHAIQSFSIALFFEEYGRSPVWKLPDYDEIHAPTNIYSVDFFKIAKAIKETRGYRCEECKRDLSMLGDRRFLHAHHKNADKSDNRQSNILLLCPHCHAKAFQHSHLRQTEDYKKFCQRFGIR
jgi:hypothetical protein